MIKLFFTISILFFALVSNAQITFQKTFGGFDYDGAFFIQQTSDSGYMVTGFTNSFGAGDENVYLIKTDINGDSLWTKTFGGTYYEYASSGQQTTDGGYIIAGRSATFGAGSEDIYLVRSDSNGDTLWTKTYGGTSPDVAFSVQQTADGGYVITGPTNSFGAGVQNVYLIKTDANGDTLWTKTYSGANTNQGGSVQQTIDGGYIIAGVTIIFGADVYLIKTDAIGDTLWTKCFGGTNYDWAASCQQTADGGYVITGGTESFGAGGDDIYLIKTDSIGNLISSKTFGGSNDDSGNSVQQTSDGGYVIVGWTYSFGVDSADIYLVKTDSNGNLLWTKTFGGTNYDFGLSVQETKDKGYIICGYTQSFGAGLNDVYLIKTDSLGNSGCNEGSTTATIVTIPATQVTIPATIVGSAPFVVTSPATIVGSGGIVTTLCSNVGINEIAIYNSFLISPNPSSGNFIISFGETIIKGKIEISNVLGKNVFTENIFNDSKKEIKLKNISSGIYFVKVFDGAKSYCKKLIVE